MAIELFIYKFYQSRLKNILHPKTPYSNSTQKIAIRHIYTSTFELYTLKIHMNMFGNDILFICILLYKLREINQKMFHCSSCREKQIRSPQINHNQPNPQQKYEYQQPNIPNNVTNEECAICYQKIPTNLMNGHFGMHVENGQTEYTHISRMNLSQYEYQPRIDSSFQNFQHPSPRFPPRPRLQIGRILKPIFESIEVAIELSQEQYLYDLQSQEPRRQQLNPQSDILFLHPRGLVNRINSYDQAQSSQHRHYQQHQRGQEVNRINAFYYPQSSESRHQQQHRQQGYHPIQQQSRQVDRFNERSNQGLDIDGMNDAQIYEYFTNLDLEQKHGFQKESLQFVSTFPFKKIQRQQNQQESDDCQVCMSELEEGQMVVILGCAHVYHEECIKKWLEIKKFCPVCHQEVKLTN